MAIVKEFQEFIAKGNVMDLAVGVIIGAAFGKIVDSLVNDIIMPIVGAIFGGLDFNNYFLPLSSSVTATSLAQAKEQGAVFAYGSFITVVLNFLILAWIIFLMVKAVNNMRKRLEAEKPAPAAAPPPADIALLTDIRDLLAKGAKAK
jgi:large conductance mechanosensitive channel